MNTGRKCCVPLTVLACCALVVATSFRTNRVSATPLRLTQEVTGENETVPNDAWAPALLYDIVSSPSPAALRALYDAAFATGPVMIPQLEAALKDDRTAEFAAQSLALIGGEEAFKALSKLVNDRRDLELRRFYYGALGEIDTPAASDYLLNIVSHANNQPDRTVTEAAIIALTVHSRADLILQLKQVEAKLTDPVIQDDLENAIDVIQARAHYLATHKNTGGSIQDAINLYFEPAFETASAAGQASAENHGARGAQSPTPSPSVKVEIQHLEFNPTQTRALARVTFTDEGVSEHYRIVLQKRFGDWTVASVWLAMGEEKVLPGTDIDHHAGTSPAIKQSASAPKTNGVN